MPLNHPRRSALYMPGANPRALEKAKTLAADTLILDLEDSVAPEAKDEARARVAEAVGAGGYGRREIVIRVNGLETEWGEADLAAAAAAGPDAILVPKVASPDHVHRARSLLVASNAPETLPLWAMVETPLAILNAQSIAAAAGSAAAPLTVFVMGTNDLAKETRAEAGADRAPMIPWLATTVAAARAYGLDILDGVYNAFRDEAGFARECAQGRALGMDGKTLIHPSQIAPANEIFAPSAEEVDWSRMILAAFAEPGNAAKGVITLDGRMVERLHAEMAARTVAIAEAIAEMDVG